MKPTVKSAAAIEKLKSRLITYAEKGDRDDPLAFAGRDTEIGRITRSAKCRTEKDDGQEEPKNWPKGQTFLIDGAPGAGKTALLTELNQRLARINIPVIAREEVPDEEGVDDILHTLMAHFTGRSIDATWKSVQSHDEFTGGVPGVASVKSSSTESDRRSGRLTIERIAQAAEGQRKKPITVFIDEVQNIERDTKAAHFTRVLHTQSKLPILLVCAGLANARSSLKDAGASRISPDKNFHLDTLTTEETLDCAVRTLRILIQWGVRGDEDDIREWAQRLAQTASDWPRHLQCSLRGAAEALAEQDFPSLKTLPPEKALEAGARLRQDYYAHRLESCNTPLAVCAHVQQALRDAPMEKEFAADLCGEAADAYLSERAKARYDRQYDGNDMLCLKDMLKAGVVTHDVNGFYKSPIPSFADYTLEQCRRTGIEVNSSRGCNAPKM